MNHAGHLDKDLIVVLNDNEMSIAGKCRRTLQLPQPHLFHGAIDGFDA